MKTPKEKAEDLIEDAVKIVSWSGDREVVLQRIKRFAIKLAEERLIALAYDKKYESIPEWIDVITEIENYPIK